jgi:excisionase family DNA binding protein
VKDDAQRDGDRHTDFLTARQLAAILQVSESTVRRLAQQGRIPSIRLTSHLIRFHLPSVMSALDGSQRQAKHARRPPHEDGDDSQLSLTGLFESSDE